MRGAHKGFPLMTNRKPNCSAPRPWSAPRRCSTKVLPCVASCSLSGENGVGKSALAGRWLRSLQPKAYFPVCITQASLTGIGLLSLFLQKLGKVHNHQRSASLKLLEEAFGELGRIIPVLLLDEAQNYA